MVFTVSNNIPLRKLRASSSCLVVTNSQVGYPTVVLPVTWPSIHTQTAVLLYRHMSPDRVTATSPTCLYSTLNRCVYLLIFGYFLPLCMKQHVGQDIHSVVASSSSFSSLMSRDLARSSIRLDMMVSSTLQQKLTSLPIVFFCFLTSTLRFFCW